jgi:hypothetical protein
MRSTAIPPVLSWTWSLLLGSWRTHGTTCPINPFSQEKDNSCCLDINCSIIIVCGGRCIFRSQKLPAVYDVTTFNHLVTNSSGVRSAVRAHSDKILLLRQGKVPDKASFFLFFCPRS